jgi:uncharacterized membrane protein YccC
MDRALIARRSLIGQIGQHRAELALSLRVTIAAVSSFALSHAFHLPLPLWTVLTSVILTQVTFGDSLKATIDYLVGTFCGAIFGGAIAILIPHESLVAQAGVLALTVAPLALLGGIKPRFITATFTGVLVLMVPEITHVSPAESAVYRVLEVTVGGLTALVTSLLVVPARAHSLLTEAAAHMLNLLAQALPAFADALAGSSDAAAIGELQDKIGEALSRAEALAARVGHERIGLFAAVPDSGPLLRTLLRLRHDFVILGRAAAVPLPEAFQKRFAPGLRHIAAMVADALRQLADALIAQREPPPLDAAERGLEAFTETFAQVRQEGLTRGLPVETVEGIFALGFGLDQLRGHLRDLDRCVREAARAK